ncbi:MAG: hypothetical protein L0Z62_02250 [Gemmataceae bacterium]|nr:hypothetical protein [Gemmataceae bacterium]
MDLHWLLSPELIPFGAKGVHLSLELLSMGRFGFEPAAGLLQLLRETILEGLLRSVCLCQRALHFPHLGFQLLAQVDLRWLLGPELISFGAKRFNLALKPMELLSGARFGLEPVAGWLQLLRETILEGLLRSVRLCQGVLLREHLGFQLLAQARPRWLLSPELISFGSKRFNLSLKPKDMFLLACFGFELSLSIEPCFLEAIAVLADGFEFPGCGVVGRADGRCRGARTLFRGSMEFAAIW